MNQKLLTLITFAAIAAANLAARAADDSDQLAFPQITRQPIDQAIPVGSNAVFSAQATNGNLTFQWFRNGVAMDGQTNSDLVLESVGIADVGYFTCNISKDGGESVPTRTASLNVFTALAGGPITVFGSPVISGGFQGGWARAPVGYLEYIQKGSHGLG